VAPFHWTKDAFDIPQNLRHKKEVPKIRSRVRTLAEAGSLIHVENLQVIQHKLKRADFRTAKFRMKAIKEPVFTLLFE
jgi:hypothetical protein